MSRPNILLAFSQRIREQYLGTSDLERLDRLADWDWFECEGGSIETTNEDPSVAEALRGLVEDRDGIIICHGSPTIDDSILDCAPKLRIVGELEGDRFASRLELEALWARGVRTVDTNNASSYPVADWALALMLLACRNGGFHFRRIIAGDTDLDREALEVGAGTLMGSQIGLIGCGHMGRRLIKLVRAFEPAQIWVCDPYLSREMAEVVGFVQTSLTHVLSHCDIIVCLAPLTPKTRRMIGRAELDLIRPGSTLVNVSRGPIIDPEALIERLKKGDITAGLDVFDPEPIPADSEISKLPNVFLSPHIGWYRPKVMQQYFTLMMDEFERFFSGHEPWFDLTPHSKDNRQGN